jgi:hypothetical protein
MRHLTLTGNIHLIPQGREITADFDYVTYNNVSDMILTTDYYTSTLQKTSTTYLKGYLPSDINIYTFKSDYTQPVKGGGRFEAGVKFSYVKNDNLVNYERMVNNEWETDVIRSNHFIYDETIAAGVCQF